jgi:TP901 family phage tail tape measure protein
MAFGFSAFEKGIAFPVTADISGLKAGLGQAQAELDKTASSIGKSMQDLGKNMTSMGKSLSMKVTAPIVAMGAASLYTAVNFDDSMQKVRAISGATGDQFDQLRDQAMELGRSTRYSASEAAEGMSFLAMAGFEVTDIMASMPAMLDLAAAGAIDLGVAADIASNILTGFNMDASEAVRVADLMAATAASANTDITQLGEAMKYVAPIAAGVGMSMEETAAAIGMLSNAGIQGSMAGTTLRQAISSLISPTGSAQEILDRLGITATDSAGNMLPFADILSQLESSGMSTAEAMEVFGARAGPGMVALMAQGSDAMRDYTGELQSSAGAAQEMADVMESGPGGAFRTMKSTIEDLMIQFGDIISEAILPLLEHIRTLVQWFAGLDEGTKKIIVVMAAAAAAIGPLLIVIGMLVGAIGSIITIIPTLMAGLTLLAAHPILLAIMAIIVVAVILETKFGILTKAAKVLSDGWKWLTDKVITPFVDWMTKATEGVDWLGIALKLLLGPIGWVMIAMEHFGISWEDIWNGVVSVMGSAADFIGGIFDTIIGNFKFMVNMVIGGVNVMIRALNQIRVDVPSWIPGFGGQSFGFSVPEIPRLAEGGIVTKPTIAMIGEAGPEAIVPLDRGGGMPGDITITGNTFNVRNDQDIKLIAQELQGLIARNNRARGIL